VKCENVKVTKTLMS